MSKNPVLPPNRRPDLGHREGVLVVVGRARKQSKTTSVSRTPLPCCPTGLGSGHSRLQHPHVLQLKTTKIIVQAQPQKVKRVDRRRR